MTSLADLVPIRPRPPGPRQPDSRIADEEAFLALLAGGLHRLLKLRHELRSITLEITRRCNLECRHCYMTATPAPPASELKFAELAGLGLSIRRTLGTAVAVAITGGEPLLRPDLMPVLRLYRTLGLTLSLSTNGTRLTPGTAARLAPLLGAISISLDGTRRGHEWLRGRGSFEPAMRGLVTAVHAGIPHVALKTAVHPGNLDELPTLLALTRKLRLPEWHLFPIESLGRAARHEDLLLSADQHDRLLEFVDTARTAGVPRVVLGERRPSRRASSRCRATCPKRCSAGISTLAVLHDGRVSACVLGARDEAEAEGNVRRRALADIWRRQFKRNRAPGWRTCDHHRFE